MNPVTPRELMRELRLIIRNHPEAADHTLFAQENAWDDLAHITGRSPFQIRFLRWDGKRKRIILEE